MQRAQFFSFVPLKYKVPENRISQTINIQHSENSSHCKHLDKLISFSFSRRLLSWCIFKYFFLKQVQVEEHLVTKLLLHIKEAQ